MDERNAKEIEHHAQRQAGAKAHARATLVRPLDGHDRHRVAALPREMDDLGVKDDAADLLETEEVVGSGTSEALEATLRVRDGSCHPERGQGVEDAAEKAAMRRLRAAPVTAIRMDPAAESDVMRIERLGQQRQLVGRCREVRIGKEDVVALRREHAGPDGGPLTGVVAPQQPQAGMGAAIRLLAGADDLGRRVGRSVVDHEYLEPAHVGRWPATLAGVAGPVQVPEQLVERRPDATRFVVRGQDQRDRRLTRVVGAW